MNELTDAGLDFDGALARMAGDRSLLAAVARFYFEDSPALMSRIRKAVEEFDADDLERAAHSLKGLASNFGPSGVVESAGALEQMGRAAQMAEAVETLARLERALAQLNSALENYLAPAELAKESMDSGHA